MDLQKIGLFLAQLRKEHSMTQQELGETLGVSNKTVSRWETGTYLPPAEILQMLSDLYGITINEILSAQRLQQEQYREKAEENIKTALTHSSFSLKDKIHFFKTKWKKEHMTSAIFAFVLFSGLLLYAIAAGNRIEGAASIVILCYCCFLIMRHNSMMAYVEGNVFQVPDMSKADEDFARKKSISIRRWRIGSMLILCVSLLITMDLGYNYFSSQVAEINDGLTVRGVFSSWFFGDDGWTELKFSQGFMFSWCSSICIGIGNLILACIEKLNPQ